MSKEHQRGKSIQKLPPIVIVPDKSYVDDTGHLIPTDVIILIAPQSHATLSKTVENAGGLNKDIMKTKLKNDESKS